MTVKPPPKQPPKPARWLWILWGVFLAYMLVAPMVTGTVETLPYSTLESLVDNGKVAKLIVSGGRIEGELKAPDENGRTRFVTERVPDDVAHLAAGRGIEVSAEPQSSLVGTLAAWILPPLIFVGIWVLAGRFLGSGLGGVMAVGRSRAKLFVETDVSASFADVAGVDEAKAELREIVDYLKLPEQFGRLGAHAPRGILLVGPPGTGKTLLARAVAGEAGVPFFSSNGSEFVEMFVGVGAARVRDLFEQARASASCIIFIDELDALGRARGMGPMGGTDEKEQTLNQLLAEMDGFDRAAPVVILAATNRPEVLDPALLRAGRFDRQILVDRPDRKGRAEILKVHLKKVPLAAECDVDELAALTPGFNGADLATLANEAAVTATRRGAAAVGKADFIAAFERIVAGIEKRSRVLIPRERRIVAFHEMGHALVALAIPGIDPVQKVSIIPRGIGALGYTMQRPLDDRFLMGRQEMLDRMAVLLGGRAAELLIFGDASTGAADDLAKATDIARSMVMRYGMEADLGPVAWDTEPGQFLDGPGSFWRPRRFAEETAREIDCAVRGLVETALARALDILRTNRDRLDQGAAMLLARETLEAGDLPRPRPSSDATPAAVPDAPDRALDLAQGHLPAGI